jgi:hypothetical protein
VQARVYRLTAPFQLQIEDEDVPPCGPGMVLAETVYSLLSPGTELGAWNGSRALRVGTGYPRVVGYCNLARVIESGDPSIVAGDHILTHQSHRSHFCIPADEVLAQAPCEPASATAYLYFLAFRALDHAEFRTLAIVGLGALGYAAADLALLRALPPTVVTDQKVALEGVTVRDRALVGEFGHVVVTTNAWSDYQLALRLSTEIVTLLGFPGRTQGAPDFNPLAALYPKGLTLRQIGEVPMPAVKNGVRRMLGLMPLLRPEPLIGQRVAWGELEAVYRAPRVGYSTLLEW